MLKMRNPWGSSDWKGAYSEGTATYTALNTALTAKGEPSKTEGGKFWMAWEDFVAQVSNVDMSYSQQSRSADAKERVEYHDSIVLKNEETQSVRVTLWEDIDLTKNYLGMYTYQGGNLVGTDRNPNFTKDNTYYFRYNLVPVDGTNTFSKKWHGFGMH